MAKIKGWKKTREGHYVWEGEIKKTPYAGSEHRPRVDIMKNRFSAWSVFYSGRSGLIREKAFSTKQEATDYAIKYMRMNPNG